MDKQQAAQDLAEEILADIELQRLRPVEIIMKASRLARLTEREDLSDFLRYERDGYPLDGSATGWLKRAARGDPSDDTGTVYYFIPLARVEALAESYRSALTALQGGGNYSGEWASIAGGSHDTHITNQSRNLASMTAISQQVVSVVYGMVTETYHELLFSQLQATLFGDVQRQIDGSLAEAGGGALTKIASVSARLRDSEPESVSQAMTTCRRLIDSVSDHVFPAREESFDINGQTLQVNQQNVLNRLQAYVASHEPSKGRRDRLRRTVGDLYGRCSTGTHADMTVDEARFVFLQTYVVLGEILALDADKT